MPFNSGPKPALLHSLGIESRHGHRCWRPSATQVPISNRRMSILTALACILPPHVTHQTRFGQIDTAPRVFGARPREGHGHRRVARRRGRRPHRIGDFTTTEAAHERAVPHHRCHGAPELAAKGPGDFALQRDLSRAEARASRHAHADLDVGSSSSDAGTIYSASIIPAISWCARARRAW